MRPLLPRSSFFLLFSLLAACAPHVATGGTGSTGGAGGTGGCPAPSPGMCSPNPSCVDGLQQTGEATCIDGQWVCTTEPCEMGAGGGCSGGSPFQVCSDGMITSSCCPAGAPCAAEIFCDLGDGTCIPDVTCDELDGGAPCATIEASHYEQSCASDADCTAVYEGSLCSACFCPNAAISQSALAAYQSDFAADGPHPTTCNCPASPAPVCSSGVCTKS